MSRFSFLSPPGVAGCVLVLGLLGLAGCGGGSKTYPVKGKVVLKGGDVSKLAGGTVYFQSPSDPNLIVTGAIEDGGAFTMGTVRESKHLPGVPAGQYKARVEPPGDDDGNPQRGIIHPKYQDFDKSGLTVRVPASDDLTIEVERPGR